MKLQKVFNRAFLPIRKHYYLPKFNKSNPGSIAWLIGTEIKYGGMVTKVPRNKVSPKDPRTKEQLLYGGMVGGDRMLLNYYSKMYSKYLLPFVERGQSLTVAEFGILKGTGLAIWCDLFTNSRILGFDIDLAIINDNMENLTNLGAFRTNQPELYECDQYLDNTASLGSILKESKIDICIDDGPHSIESICTTMRSVMPYLAENFVYFIEDNKYVHKEIRSTFPDLIIDNKGPFTVVTRA